MKSAEFFLKELKILDVLRGTVAILEVEPHLERWGKAPQKREDLAVAHLRAEVHIRWLQRGLVTRVPTRLDLVCVLELNLS